MKWNSSLYDDKHSFVSEYGKKIIGFVNIEREQKILDLGCGTGLLTKELAKKGAEVIGVDSSREMIQRAKVNYSNLKFQVEDAIKLPFENKFDTVFSNAVFHWILNQKGLLEGIYKVLKKDGLLVCEFGAKGNIRKIEDAFKKSIEAKGIQYISKFSFPSMEEYKALLETAGFKVKHIVVYDRPTILADGKNGLRNWILQFFSDYLEKLSDKEIEEVLMKSEEICQNTLWKDTQWVADYKRIQVIAVKI